MPGIPTAMIDNNRAIALTSMTKAIAGIKLPRALMFLTTQKQNAPKASQNMARHRNSLSAAAATVVFTPGIAVAPPMRSPIPVKRETPNIMYKQGLSNVGFILIPLLAQIWGHPNTLATQ